MRRTNAEIVAELKAKAAKMEADHDRRLCVASNPICSWLWDAECALHRARLALLEDDPQRPYVAESANNVKALREARWKKIKEESRA